ncbi:MAG TPA: NAD(P)/FAD-dependent oxidoreductase [Syntrophobacteraceae bacterium]|nr:NAD(P)/FAD-dependent oxidoreductase [Syntrophobacteraceae bacterium]
MSRVAGDQSISRRDFMKTAAALAAGMTARWDVLEALAAGIPKGDLPVVVIGAGLGGLSAAALLARNGFPVTLVEQHEKPGGYATTFDRAGGKFTFDVSLHLVSGAKNWLGPIFEGTGIRDKIQMVQLPELCRIVAPHHDFLWPNHPDAAIDALIELFPTEALGIRGFFAQMLGLADEIMVPFSPDSILDRVFFPLTHKRMWALRNKTLAEVLDAHVRDPQLRGLLSAYWGYYGLPPSRLSGFLYTVATGSFLRFGAHYIKRRSQDLSDALLEAVETAGGKVLLETEAVGIEMRGGKIAGVRLEGGTLLPAGAVISNAGVPSTVKMLPSGALPGDYLRKLEGYRPSLSTFCVWLGLNGEIRDRVKGYEVFVLRDYDPERAFRASLVCDPAAGSLAVTLYDNCYPGYSRPGTSTVSILMSCAYEPWRRFEADYFAGRKDAYRKEKERIARVLVEETERRVIPGLTSMIEVMEASTPLTNLRYTRNPEGAVYGYEQTLSNSFMTRLDNRTPLKGLYFASAWTFPGGGYEPCLESGARAYRALVTDWTPRA